MHKKHLYAFAFISWMVFVTFSSLYSFEKDDFSSFNIPYADKIVHFTFYFVGFVLGALFIKQLKEHQKRNLRKLKVLAFLLIIFGILIEVIQGTLTVDRFGDVFDALANSVGVAIGFLVIFRRFYGQSGLN